MPETLVFRFPMPSANLGSNSRAHWAVKHKEKKALWAACDILVAGKINPKPPKKPWEKATIAVRMVVFNPLDHDGATGRTKVLQDWLVKRKYLVDDRTKNLKPEGGIEQRISRKNTPEIEIVLTRDA